MESARVSLPPPSQQGDIWVAFLSILFEGIPFILIGSIVSGLIDAYLPARLMDRMLPKRGIPAVLASGLLGIIFPVCECAIVPVIRRLVQKGLPLGCAMTYMLAAPIVNPIVALSTYSAFQGREPAMMTASRVLLGYAIAVVAGLVLSRAGAGRVLQPRVLQGMAAGAADAADAGRAPGDGIVRAMRTAQQDFMDTVLYFVIGVGIASVAQTQLFYRPGLQDGIQSLAANHWLAAPVLMVAAFVLSLCSTTDAFIIAADSLFAATAKLAFLVFGPMFDMKLIFLYSTVLRPKAVFWLAIGLFVAVYLATLGLQPILEPVPVPK
jgi:uncharacterized membrane protein YraQ (UPF0718 family)